MTEQEIKDLMFQKHQERAKIENEIRILENQFVDEFSKFKTGDKVIFEGREYWVTTDIFYRGCGEVLYRICEDECHIDCDEDEWDEWNTDHAWESQLTKVGE